MRQVVLDTETTGLEVEEDHRVIEIGCVEIVDRRLTGRHYHQYINPERDIDDGALQVHGITREFLLDKPKFAEIWQGFLEFVEGAELVIHNADFDIAFLDQELKLIEVSAGSLTDYCSVIDSLDIARRKHPGQKNNLDALCKRYDVDNSQRNLHGALLDAEILADVYLLMTGGQVNLGLGDGYETLGIVAASGRLANDRPRLKVIKANTSEIRAHEVKLDELDQISESGSFWRKKPTQP